MERKQIQINSLSAKIATTIYPKEDAETIILLHGGPGLPMDYTPIIEILSQKYQVITFNQRGTGGSPVTGKAYSISHHIADIDAIADHFKLKTFHLWGHSWGGLYAQLYIEAKKERVSSLFLCSAAPGTGAIWSQVEKESLAFQRSQVSLWEWICLLVKSILGSFGITSFTRSVMKTVIENYHKPFNPDFKATDELVKDVESEPVKHVAPHLKKHPILPTPAMVEQRIMITYGDNDVVGKSREFLKARFPDAPFTIIENSGHLPWVQNISQFQEILNNFYHI